MSITPAPGLDARIVEPGTLSEMPDRRRPLIHAKLRAPVVPDVVVARPRIERTIRDLLRTRRVVVVTATAGAGKTVAVASSLATSQDPVCWLSVDRTDRAPGRLLAYLEAALATVGDGIEGTVSRTPGSAVPHPEAGGLLADALDGRPAVLVLDDLERLGEGRAAWDVLESFVRHAPNTLRIVLLSRVPLPPGLVASPSPETIGALGEATLAFTPEEADEALRARGARDVDPAAAVTATGGWVTGVLFESWRATAHVSGVGGAADPLYGYLSAHIVSELEDDDRRFLVDTSLLDDVTPARAGALGIVDAAARLASIRRRHVPVSFEDDGRTMRCHPRFREYLRNELEHRSDAHTNRLRIAHGRLLASEGRYEDATEELLLAGALDDARTVAERVVVGVVERLDNPVAERWIAQLAPVIPPGATSFATAELLLAVAQDDFGRGAAVADRLAGAGERDDAARSSEQTAALMAWCYGAVNRFPDGRAILDIADRGPTVASVRYAFRLCDQGPVEPRPEPTGSALDAIIHWCDYYYGRLTEMSEEAPSPWAAAISKPWRIAALRATGKTIRALDAYDAARNDAGRNDGRLPVFLEAIVGPEILADAGRPGEALRLVARTRERARASAPFFALGNAIVEARTLLRHGGDLEAGLEVLRRAASSSPSARIPMFREMLDTWVGFGLLRAGDDAPALDHLRHAVASMVESDRILELAPAAVYLSEAAWRAGLEDEADRAADVALQAAARHGSNHLLLQALSDFSAVASRRIDAEPSADSAWHDLGRVLVLGGDVELRATPRSAVDVADFGRCSIVVDGQEVRPKITKSAELLAFLAVQERPEVSRDALLAALFDDRDDRSTRSYLREAVRRLREVLPDRSLETEDGGALLTTHVQLSAASRTFERQVTEARRLRGRERLDGLLDALALPQAGPYLQEVESQWAEDRRRDLRAMIADARYDAARTCYELGRYVRARELLRPVLDEDPFREAGWRLAMRVADATGDGDEVLAAYRRCREALQRVDVEPSTSTRRLLDDLRG